MSTRKFIIVCLFGALSGGELAYAVDGSLDRDLIRRKAFMEEPKSGAQQQQPQYKPVLKVKPKGDKAKDKTSKPQRQKGIEPDEIDRR